MIIGLAATASMTSGCPDCGRIDPPVDEVSCDFTAATTETTPQDACLGELLLPATTFPRDKAAPATADVEFVVPGEGEVCVRVVNGIGDSGRVSAGRIAIDGDDGLSSPLVLPADFNQTVTLIEKRATLSAGSHLLRVRVASQPGAAVTVEVRFAAEASEEEIAAKEEEIDLRQLACEQFNRELRLLGPDDAERAKATSIGLGIAPGQMRVRTSAYGIPRRLEPLPNEDFGQQVDDGPETVALKWLMHHQALMRWDPEVSTLVLDYVKPAHQNVARVRFRQTVAGLPVENALLEITVNGDQVSRLQGNFVPDLPGSLVPTVTSTEAEARAVALAADPSTAQVLADPVLVVYDTSPSTGRAVALLAWRVAVSSLAVPRGETLWIDADSGVLIARSGPAVEGPQFEVYQGDDEVHEEEPEPLEVVLDDELAIDDCVGSSLDWCNNMVQGAALLDTEWRVLFGREGWSDDGLPALPGEPGTEIPANDHYRIVLDPDGRPGLWFPTAALEDAFPNIYDFPSRPGRRADGRVVVLNAITTFASPLFGAIGPSFDPVRHEFGHGLYQVEVGLRGSVTESIPAPFRFIWEHAAEFWTMANEDDPSPFLHTYQQGVQPVTDQSRLVVGGSSSDPCRSFEHMNYLMDDLTVDPDTFDWVHKNACVLDRLAYRVLEDGTSSFAHAVQSRGLGLDTGRFLFYEIFTQHATLTDDIFDYADHYRGAVASLVAKCDPILGEGGDACRDDRDELQDGMDPLWGVGFYSQPIDVTGVDNRIRTGFTPAAITLGGRVEVLYVSADTHELMLAEFDDPIGTVPPVSITSVSGALAGTPDIFFFSVAKMDENTALLAFVTSAASGPNVRVATITRDPFTVIEDSTPGLASLRVEPFDRPAIVHDGTKWVLIGSEAGTHRLMQLEQGEASAQPLPAARGACGIVPEPLFDLIQGSSPQLLIDPIFGGVTLVYLERSELTFPGAPDISFRVSLRSRVAGGRWCVPLFLEHRTDSGVSSEAPESFDPPFATFFPSPLVSPPVEPRLQVFYSPRRLTTTDPRLVRQITLGAPEPFDGPLPTIPWDVGDESRSVALVNGGSAGVAATPFDDLQHGEILLLYYLSTDVPSRVQLMYKRSD